MPTEKKILYAMQCVLFLLGATFIYGIIWQPMTADGTEHSKTVLGFILGTLFGTLLNYNWGTSKGSVDKTEAAEKRLDTAAGNPTEGGPAVTQKKTETTETTLVSNPTEIIKKEGEK